MTGMRLGALAILIGSAACSSPATSKADKQAEPVTAAVAVCTLERTSEGRVAVLRGTCPRTAQGISAALRARGSALNGVAEIFLGNVPFGADGVFDRCDLLGRLARDPRWTAGIDSAAAQPVLIATLNAMRPAAAVVEALGSSTAGVSAEKVILEPPGTDCPAAPSRVPVEALLWLDLKG